MPHNFYLGDNELVIVIRNGVNVVLEKYEEYDESQQPCYECLQTPARTDGSHKPVRFKDTK